MKMPDWKSVPALIRGQAGGVAVEFALILPVLLLFLLGTIEFGRAIWMQHTLQFAAEEATRYAIVNDGATAEDIRTYMSGKLPGVDRDTVTLSVSFTASEVTAQASHRLQLVISSLIPIEPVTITGFSRFALR